MSDELAALRAQVEERDRTIKAQDLHRQDLEARLAESERTAANCHGEYHKAEAKLARVVEALSALREESKAMPIPEAIPEAHKERVLVLRAHIADVTGLAAAREQPTQEEKLPLGHPFRRGSPVSYCEEKPRRLR
jgi:chromosome segregation ATPase